MTHRPKHLGHVNLYVRNADRSRQWYEDVLGLHTYDFRPGRAAFMSADRDKSHEVALMQVGDDAPLQHKGQVGLNHLAFMMESLDDLKEAYLRLKEKSVKIDRIADHGVSLGIYFRDPDGNGLEISYELPRQQWPREDRIFAADMVNRGPAPGTLTRRTSDSGRRGEALGRLVQGD
jgi:catechol 2,3-dioxygenase